MATLAEGVRAERTGWRDEELSRRHRLWGYNVPCVDLDFPLVEYNRGRTVALIEYKRFTAQSLNFKHPTFDALRHLANNAGGEIPLFVAVYWPDVWAFELHALNDSAERALGGDSVRRVTEQQFVAGLYMIRGQPVPDEVSKLNNLLPARPV